MKQIDGFSKLTKAQKIAWLCNTYFPNIENAASFLKSTTTLILTFRNCTTSLLKIQSLTTICPLR